MSTHASLTVIAIVISATGNVIYLLDLMRTKTKPHVFTWLVWAVLDVIIFLAQLVSGAGVASFVILANGIFSLIIFAVATRRSDISIVFADWIFLAGAGLAMILWVMTNGPLLSVILISTMGIFGFMPTIRKSISQPYAETVVYFLLQGTRSALTVIALEEFTVVTALDPFVLIFVNFGFALFLVVMRKHHTNLADHQSVHSIIPAPNL
jgi:hypothetical protein